MTLREHWDRQADAWARFARTPGHDAFHEEFNLPAFLELLPPPGRATLDLGCGEGRVGAELARRGHRVTGIDSSPEIVELARERHEAVVGDAAALPFDDASFDLVIAYMSLMNMDDLDAVVREVARVLVPGGRLCSSDIHPINVGTFEEEEPDSPFVIRGSYVDPEPKLWKSDRDGIQMTFWDQPIPLERYSRAFEAAGLLIEAVREPRPPKAFLRRRPIAARLLRVPLLLHLRAVKR
jgi:SAM-dependent methyltransferase